MMRLLFKLIWSNDSFDSEEEKDKSLWLPYIYFGW